MPRHELSDYDAFVLAYVPHAELLKHEEAILEAIRADREAAEQLARDCEGIAPRTRQRHNAVYYPAAVRVPA